MAGGGYGYSGGLAAPRWGGYDLYTAQMQQSRPLSEQAAAMRNMARREVEYIAEIERKPEDRARLLADRLEAWRSEFSRDMDAFARDQRAWAVEQTKRAAWALAAASIAYLGVCWWVAAMAAR